MPPSLLKKTLRKTYLAKRKSLSNAELELLSQKICTHFFTHFSVASYQSIHVFLPIQKQNEIDTWLIIKRLQNDFPNIKIIVPRIAENGELENFLFTKETILEENHLKIQEPVWQSAVGNQLSAGCVPHEAIDLVLLPLLIFDKKGNRVGYGKGFYDRFLAKCRIDTQKVGLSFFEPVEAIEDVNEFDVKMNACITPEGVWRF